MGEIHKIIREHYPVEKLPEDLRQGLAAGAMVRVTVESEVDAENPSNSMRSLVGRARKPGRSADEIVAEIRQLRDEWER